MKKDYLYRSRELRDKKYRELKAQGVKCIRRTTGPSQIHPQYIEDEDPELRKQTGFGNTVYRTYYARLYGITVEKC
jgi:hypothetical protein